MTPAPFHEVFFGTRSATRRERGCERHATAPSGVRAHRARSPVAALTNASRPILEVGNGGPAKAARIRAEACGRGTGACDGATTMSFAVTTCPFCAVGCGLRLEADGGGAARCDRSADIPSRAGSCAPGLERRGRGESPRPSAQRVDARRRPPGTRPARAGARTRRPRRSAAVADGGRATRSASSRAHARPTRTPSRAMLVCAPLRDRHQQRRPLRTGLPRTVGGGAERTLGSGAMTNLDRRHRAGQTSSSPSARHDRRTIPSSGAHLAPRGRGGA